MFHKLQLFYCSLLNAPRQFLCCVLTVYPVRNGLLDHLQCNHQEYNRPIHNKENSGSAWATCGVVAIWRHDLCPFRFLVLQTRVHTVFV